MDKFPEQIEVLIPVYNDWESLVMLIDKIHQNISSDFFKSISFTIVNDCSTLSMKEFDIPDYTRIEIVNLSNNLGHQKAIAIGLSYIAKNKNPDFILVMDSDGEDKPEDLEKMILAAVGNPNSIVFGKRTKRYEGIIFRVFYTLYKFLFGLLTGKLISFGNFCVIPKKLLKHVVYVSEIWNHFSGGLLRSKLHYITVPLERGRRLHGKSKMNFISLIVHGLSSVSIYVDIVAIRLLVLTFFLIIFSLSGIAIVTGIRIFSDLAIPGWATYAVIGFTIILLQAFLLSLILAFIVLNYRTQKLFIPAVDFENHIIMTKKYE